VADHESVAAVNIRELRRTYDRQIKMPRDLVEALARTTSLAQQAWIVSRRNSRFANLSPWLDKIIQLKRQEAACLSEAPATSEKSPRPTPSWNRFYDALLEDYEPGARSDELAALFQALREELVPLAYSMSEASKKRDHDERSTREGSGLHSDAILKRTYPIERQKLFVEAVAAALGFDFQRGRLDVTAHPFCTGIGPGDTRISTRYHEHQFGDALFGVLHEVGHGLYEQGLPAAHFGTPMGQSVSLGVHESQSRLWENAVGRSRAFWKYWFPLARRVFHQTLHDVTIDQFMAAINRVERSLIRVDADEVTYNLHIIIRFELEQAMLSGDLPINDLPSAWNQKYQETLGITPGNDSEGCLQDIHWSAGLFGYFPTYTLGNLYAAQLFDRAQVDLADLDRSLMRGNTEDLLAWLREHVHRHGQKYRPADLLERATGTKPHHYAFLTTLKKRYMELYAS
jgi:carboxypeptidase Taq